MNSTASSSSGRGSTDQVTEYAQSVASGRTLACKLVRQACERHLRDLVEGPARGLTWRGDIADWACRFFALFQHSKGEWAGQRFALEPWQQFIVGSVFGWLREDGSRRFRRVYEEIPRKNGKSTKLAGVGLYMLAADGEAGAEVYAAATKKDQARIIFDEAKRMVRASPALRGRVNVFKLNLSIDRTASKFEPLSADERTLDGLNPSTVLIDEVHKHRSRAVIDVLDTALGARRQPLLWMITTAGDDDPESVYAHENQYAQQVLDGVIEDDATFAFISTIDADDRWDDPVAWSKANPNLGVSVNLAYLRDQANKARGMPAALVAFKRLHLNVRTADTAKAIDAELWRSNGCGLIDAAALRGRSCYLGVDLSSKIDITAAVRLFPPTEPGARWQVHARFWMPADDIAERQDRDRVPYRRWIEEGWIEATPGNVVDHDAIFERVMADARDTPPVDLAIDPWNAYGLIPRLQHEGIRVFEFVQGLKSYTAPTKELMAWLHARRLDHGHNPVLAWMASNLHVQTDKNENQMPTKKHSRGRIDGMTALIMCIGRALNAEQAPTPSVLVL
jgi:phage terminase large subunit-like protein